MAEPAPLNQWEKNFNSMHRVQTSTLGVDIRATITGKDGSPVYCADAKALLSEVRRDDIFTEGPLAENGGWTVTILARDLTGTPPKNSPISANGDAAGRTLRTVDELTRTNSATATFTAGDYTAKNK